MTTTTGKWQGKNSAWDLVPYLRTLQVNNKSPELAVWESTPEGTAIVEAKKVEDTNTGSGVKP
ncbi:MAG TPA: hypothetical protein VJX72_06935 [Candidatus Acidoferrum sp.]|nr:hypothetical protein [Candidatus Acidoferrum sp.]